jgi:hypothetical protein
MCPPLSGRAAQLRLAGLLNVFNARAIRASPMSPIGNPDASASDESFGPKAAVDTQKPRKDYHSWGRIDGSDSAQHNAARRFQRTA